MINRRLFTPDGDDPPCPVPINDLCTVPTQEMAYLLADLVGDAQHVLEIGTGSGYQTAILAERCKSVVTMDVERQPNVAAKLPEHVAMIVGNGYETDTGEQFDAVLVTFGSESISAMWIKQVKDGGRLVVPLKIGSCCQVRVYEKHGNALVLIDGVLYAPFTAGAEA